MRSRSTATTAAFSQVHLADVTSAASIVVAPVNLPGRPNTFVVSGGLLYASMRQPNSLQMLASPSSPPAQLLGDRAAALEPIAGGVAFASGSSSAELWKSDGTESGTVIVADLAAADGSSSISRLRANASGAELLFLFDTAVWRSDGTASGTAELVDGSMGETIALADDSIVLTYGLASESELARTNSALTTLEIVADVNTTTASSPRSPAVEFAGNTYLVSRDMLYRYDQESGVVTAVPEALADYDPDVDRDLTELLGASASHLYLTSRSGTTSLWAWDGVNPAVKIEESPGNGFQRPEFVAADGDRIVFVEPTDGLWITDGTQGGTVELIEDVNRPEVAVGSDGIVFEYSTPGEGLEPWTSDGTVAGTRLLVDLVPGSQSSRPRNFVAIGGDVYFSADGVWYVSPGGSGLPTPVASPSSGVAIEEIFEAGGKRYTVTRALGDALAAPQLWVSEGSVDELVDMPALPGGVTIRFLVAAGDVLYLGYEAARGDGGVNLVSAMEEESGTLLVVDSGVATSVDGINPADFRERAVGDDVGLVVTVESQGGVRMVDDDQTRVVHVGLDGAVTVVDSTNEIVRALRVIGDEAIYSKDTTEYGSEPHRVRLLDRETEPEPEPTAPPEIESVEPARVLDTRESGETVDDRFEKTGRVAAGGEVVLEVLGRGGVPADGVGAVILNVTMIRPDGNGFVTISPCGDRPLASSMNAPSGRGVVANEVIAKVSAAGTVCLYSSVGTHLAADVVGYVPESSSVTSLEPARVLDTRESGETVDDEFAAVGRVAAGGEVVLEVLGRGGVPADGVGAVILNVTMIRPDGNGFVTISPCGDRPLASSMNAPSGRGVVANEVIAKVSAAGTVCLYSSVGTHLAADVVGYLPTGSGLSPLEPRRLLDTRDTGETIDGQFEAVGRLTADRMVELDVLGRGGVPSDGVGAVVLNVTMIRPDSNGFVTTYPCGDRPLASSLNAPAGGGVVANELIAKVSAAGTVCVYSSVGTNLAADVTGWSPRSGVGLTHSATRGGPSCRRRRTRGRSAGPGPPRGRRRARRRPSGSSTSSRRARAR